jgi:regulator of CtrA degradation
MLPLAAAPEPGIEKVRTREEMSRLEVSGVGKTTSVTISFAERFASSSQFDTVFRQGMVLVDRTAAYLDGPGRREAKALSPAAALVYATESMRLTTRLLELASWLVIRRALKTGEIGAEEARVKRRRLRLAAIGRPSHVKGFAELPKRLQELIEASFALHDRIVLIDRALEHPEAAIADIGGNPVAEQVARLSEAFPARRH